MTYLNQRTPNEKEFDMFINFFDVYINDEGNSFGNIVNKVIHEAVKFYETKDVMDVPSENFHCIIWVSNAKVFMDKGISPEEMGIVDYIDLRNELIDNGCNNLFS